MWVRRGQEAINAGLISFVIALVLVLLFMVSYYSNAGLVADIALFANVFFIMGILASLGRADAAGNRRYRPHDRSLG